jgi:hypothetical protein
MCSNDATMFLKFRSLLSWLPATIAHIGSRATSSVCVELICETFKFLKAFHASSRIDRHQGGTSRERQCMKKAPDDTLSFVPFFEVSFDMQPRLADLLDGFLAAKPTK